MSGALPVGAILPTEDELAEAHGASRSVVREAIKLLEVHRLVRPVRRRGTEVLDPMRSLSPEVVRAMLRPAPGDVDLDMLRGLLEVRALIDVEMSALAAERRSTEDLRALEAILEELRASRNDAARFADRARQVPRALARATQNRLFEMLTAWNEVVTEDLEPFMAASRPAPEPHLQALAVLVDLVRRRDAGAVRELVSTFHAWATPRILQAAELFRSAREFALEPRRLKPGRATSAERPALASPPSPKATERAPSRSRRRRRADR